MSDFCDVMYADLCRRWDDQDALDEELSAPLGESAESMRAARERALNAALGGL